MKVTINEIFENAKTPRITSKTFLEHHRPHVNAFKCVGMHWCIVLLGPYLVMLNPDVVLGGVTVVASRSIEMWNRSDWIRIHGGLDIEKTGMVRNFECTIVDVKEF